MTVTNITDFRANAKQYIDNVINEISGRVYFTAQNPFIITNYKGIDPEISSGVDKNPYPRPMSFQFGLSLNF